MAGAFPFALESLLLAPRLAAAFQHGGGISFGELPPAIPAAIDRMHRPWFQHLLVQEWIAGVPGLVNRLGRGIRVLDVGCGLGQSTIAMARAFPTSTFLGLDPHVPSIHQARALAAEAGVRNATFVSAPVEALDVEGGPLQLVTSPSTPCTTWSNRWGRCAPCASCWSRAARSSGPSRPVRASRWRTATRKAGARQSEPLPLLDGFDGGRRRGAGHHHR